MQARVSQEGEIYVIHLAGRLDVETAEPFRDACLKHLQNKKVIFDFSGLSFVGSSGILPFLETMQEYAVKNHGGFKFSGVGVEFQRVFAATPLNVVEVHETALKAVHAFHCPVAVQAVPVVTDGEYLTLKHEPMDTDSVGEDEN